MSPQDKPRKPGSLLTQSEAKAEDIQPLEIEAVNGFRARMKRLGLSLVVGTAIGGSVGYAAREGYRHSVGYNPNIAVVTDTIGNTEEVSENKQPIKEEVSDSDKPKKLLDSAKQLLKDAKDWSGKKIEKAADKTKIVRKYREAKQGATNVYQGFLKFGDTATFWIVFSTFFLASALIANTLLLNSAKAKNEKAKIAKINEIIARVNQLALRNNATPEDAKDLMDEFEQATEGLEDGL